MEELVARLAAQFGLTEGKTRGAIGVLLKLIEAHADPKDVALLLEKLPGAQALLDSAKSPERPQGGGLFGSLAGALGGGGGLMATAADLQKQGVGLSQMRPFITAFAEQAEETVGRDVVERIAASIPGLERYRA